MDLSAVDPVLSDEEYEDIYTAQEDEDGCTLEEAVDISNVINGGCVFKLRLTDEAEREEGNLLYDSKEVFEQVHLQCADNDDDGIIPEVTPFEKIAEKMFDLTPDGKVKKKILKEGYGEVVPPNALVWFHHNSYYEMCETPFDSSYLRGSYIMRRLGMNQCVRGLEIGLQSMKAGEKAWFLVHYDYAYKKMGVPPRIPPESDILFQVEMHKFLDNDSALKIGEAEEEELKAMEFTQIYHAASALVEDANLVVKKKKYEPAVKLYRKALRCLEKAGKNSDEEEEKFFKMEVKVNTNLAVILNKLGEHQKAIVAARNAIFYNPNHAKAYYQLSISHLALGSHDKAIECALTAKRLEPRSKEVLALLTKIEKSQKLYEQNSVTFARNMFGLSNKKQDESSSSEKENKSGGEKTPQSNRSSDGTAQNQDCRTAEGEQSPEAVPNCSENFQMAVIEYIRDFMEDEDEKEIPLASNLSYDEEKFVRQQARNYRLMIQGRESNGGHCLYLIKP